MTTKIHHTSSLTQTMLDKIKAGAFEGWAKEYRKLSPYSKDYALRVSFKSATRIQKVEIFRNLCEQFNVTLDQPLEPKGCSAIEFEFLAGYYDIAEIIWQEASPKERDIMATYRNLCFAASFGLTSMMRDMMALNAHKQRSVNKPQDRSLLEFASISECPETIQYAYDVYPDDLNLSLIGFVVAASFGRFRKNNWGQALRAPKNPEEIIDHLLSLSPDFNLDGSKTCAAIFRTIKLGKVRDGKVFDFEPNEFIENLPYWITLLAMRGMTIDKAYLSPLKASDLNCTVLSKKEFAIIETLRKSETHYVDIDTLRRDIFTQSDSKARRLWQSLVNEIDHGQNTDDWDGENCCKYLKSRQIVRRYVA